MKLSVYCECISKVNNLDIFYVLYLIENDSSIVEKSIAKVKAWQEKIAGGSDEEEDNSQRPGIGTVHRRLECELLIAVEQNKYIFYFTS